MSDKEKPTGAEGEDRSLQETTRTDGGGQELPTDTGDKQMSSTMTAEQRKSEVDSMKLQRTNCKRKFTRKLNGLKERITCSDPIDALKQKYEEVRQAYEEVEKCHDKYMLAVGIDSEDSDQYMEIIDRNFDDVRAVIATLTSKSSVESSSSGSGGIKVKRLDAPSFSGNIREYPTFKKDYQRLMLRDFGNDPYALKSCLTGDALEVIRGVEDNYTEMFLRLDDKYGKPRKLADAVISELKKLKPIPDGDSKRFIAMVDIVERSWLDLEKMSLASEMNTVTMVSQIEKLLPSVQKREWVLRTDRSDEHTVLFPELLKFLLREKRALEYIDDDLRSNRPVNSKVVCQSTVAEEAEDGDTKGLVNFFQQMHESQQKYQQQAQDNMVKMTQMVANLVSSVPNQTRAESSQQMRTARTNGAIRKKCWYHGSDTHHITECATFRGLENSAKMEALRKNRCCYCCLETGHIAKYCKTKKPCELLDAQQQKCGRLHHPVLHQMQLDGNAFHNAVHKFNKQQIENVLLMFSKIACKSHKVTTLWDPGANMSLITHRMASKLGLHGKSVRLSITKVGNQTEWFDSKEYVVPLTDKQGNIWEIKAYGMSEVTADLTKVDVSKVVKLFKNIREDDIARAPGKVDLLVGTDCCILLPEVVETVDCLQLMKNQFGYCLRGSHPLITLPENVVYQAQVRIHHLAVMSDINNILIERKPSMNDKLQEFFVVESLGTSCNPKCGGCKCGKCAPGNGNYTLKEERELALIKDGMTFDSTENQWTVQYPWIKSPKELPNNVNVAIARLKSTEKRLKKKGPAYSEAYKEQIKDMENRNVARKLESRELSSYEGPVHYIQHHEVLKPDSSSTPVRIVFNSSASYMGHVLNDYWAKGPDVLNNLLAVLLKFRQRPFAITGDIAKMYNTVKLSELDQHTHRFVWRDLQDHRDPDHFILTAVPFGDRPSGTIAMLALKSTAEMKKDQFPKAAEVLIKNTYVDDILQSVDDPMEAINLAKEVEEILATGGFKIKHWLLSGDAQNMDTDLHLLKSKEEKILGLRWKPQADQFTFKVKVNFSPKYKKIHTEADVPKSEIESSVAAELTRRVALSQIATIYDPLGLLVPFTLQSKILMRELWSHRTNCEKISKNQKIGWDDPIPEQDQQQWSLFFRELYDLEKLTFERCIQPSGTVGNPMLIIFTDGSTVAYGACAYIRWKLQTGGYEARLVAAKNRIAPTRQLTVPRLELCAAILGCRLGEFIQKEMDFSFDKIMYITDSAIVRAQIQKESYGFGTFVATKVAEIQNKTSPTHWWWVSTDENPADLTTRQTHLTDMTSDSVWQCGPPYLKDSVETWPISQYCDQELPDRVGISLTSNVKKIQKSVDLSVINTERFSSYRKILRVTSRLLSAAKAKSITGICNPPNEKTLEEAEKLWVKYIQSEIPDDWQTRYQRLGPSMNEDGVIIVGQRMSKWLKDNWNQDSFILLTPSHHFVKMYIQSLHDQDHAGVEVTLAKLQSKFWVPGARRIIKSVKNKCVICRKLEKKSPGQMMGQIADERLRPSPSFHHTAVDLFGPFWIKDCVKKRVKTKVYGIVFNCLTSRSVYIDLAEGYGTGSFLATFRRFVTIRGYPGTLHSDNGTQLVSANKELRNMASNWDWSKIKQFGNDQGMNWTFNRAADAPWENGCSEALIKSIKRSLTHAIGDSILTFGELQTVMFEVANLLNERPIGIKPGADPDFGVYLCPNELLLGRASSRVPSGPWKEPTSLKQRFEFLQRVVDAFWKKWHRDYFPTLIIRNKWHHDKRNLQVGDIVLVQDSNVVRGEWKLAQVQSVCQGRDGKVRDVTVRYKVSKPGRVYQGQKDSTAHRSVHRLIVILPVEEQGEQ